MRPVRLGQHDQREPGTLVRVRQGGQAGRRRRPEADPKDLWSEEPGGVKPEGYTQIKVPEGNLIVRAERPTGSDGKPGAKPDAWYIMRDDPALSGTDIKNPEQNFDQTTNSPIVTMEFTDKGKREFQRVTSEMMPFLAASASCRWSWRRRLWQLRHSTSGSVKVPT